MKKLLFVLFGAATLSASAQTATQITNRYAMKLTQNEDGTYSLQRAERYAKVVNLASIDDLLVPYTHQNDRLSSRDYKGVETREIVYRTHDGYEL